MQGRAKARLCELAPAARGSQEAGFTQPSLHLFLYVPELGGWSRSVVKSRRTSSWGSSSRPSRSPSAASCAAAAAATRCCYCCRPTARPYRRRSPRRWSHGRDTCPSAVAVNECIIGTWRAHPFKNILQLQIYKASQSLLTHLRPNTG